MHTPISKKRWREYWLTEDRLQLYDPKGLWVIVFRMKYYGLCTYNSTNHQRSSQQEKMSMSKLLSSMLCPSLLKVQSSFRLRDLHPETGKLLFLSNIVFFFFFFEIVVCDRCDPEYEHVANVDGRAVLIFSM